MTTLTRLGRSGPALGPGLALLLVLVGLFAMHGLAPTGDTGTHLSPAHAMAGTAATPDPAHGVRSPATGVTHSPTMVQPPTTAGGRPDPAGHHDHDLMTGCLVVLTAVAGALVLLRLLRSRSPVGATSAGSRRVLRSGIPRGRPPPRPLLIRLCVIRV